MKLELSNLLPSCPGPPIPPNVQDFEGTEADSFKIVKRGITVAVRKRYSELERRNFFFTFSCSLAFPICLCDARTLFFTDSATDV